MIHNKNTMVEQKKKKKQAKPFVMPEGGIRYVLSNNISGIFFGPKNELQAHLEQQEKVQAKKAEDKFHRAFVIHPKQD